jgi:hypothetical protein
VTLPAPSTIGTYTYTITAYVNPAASNAFTGVGGLNSDPPVAPSTTPRYYATSSVTITVTDDITPTFQDTVNPAISDFTPLPSVVPSSGAATRTYDSNILTVGSISTAIRADINPTLSDTGAGIVQGTGTISTKTISSGGTIQLRAQAALVTGSSGYNTPTKAVVDFYFGTQFITSKTFTITTAPCLTSVATSTYPTGATTGDRVSLEYYVGFNYNDTTGAAVSSTINNLLKTPSLIPTNIVGNATNYYATVLSTPTVPNSGLFSGSTTPITWQSLITAIWNTYTSTLQRPPLEIELTSVLNDLNPELYTSMANFQSTRIQQLANSSLPARRTTLGATDNLLDYPCRNTIKSGAYTLVGGINV